MTDLPGLQFGRAARPDDRARRAGGPAARDADPWRLAGRPHPGRAHAAPNRTRTPGLRGDEDELYRRHHHDLERAVANAVHAPRELIEDACQNAWAIMLRAQPDRTSILGWLYVVATR